MAVVVWKIDPREPVGPPTPYQRRLHAFAQRTAGPGDDAPVYCWFARRDEQGTWPTSYAALTRPADERQPRLRRATRRTCRAP